MSDSCRCPKPRGILRGILLLLLLLVICAGVSFLTVNWVMRYGPALHENPHNQDWLSKELELSAAETAAIHSFDAEYRRQRTELLQTFNERMEALGGILRTSNSYTDEVAAAVHSLHEVHGELQSLSIQHFYQMLAVLPPEKQAKLRTLAIQALSQPE